MMLSEALNLRHSNGGRSNADLPCHEGEHQLALRLQPSVDMMAGQKAARERQMAEQQQQMMQLMQALTPQQRQHLQMMPHQQQVHCPA